MISGVTSQPTQTHSARSTRSTEESGFLRVPLASPVQLQLGNRRKLALAKPVAHGDWYHGLGA